MRYLKMMVMQRRVAIIRSRILIKCNSTFREANRPLAVTPLQRLVVGAGAAIAGFIDPSRGDMIALLGELTGEPALRRMLTEMQASREGRELLMEKPRIRYADVVASRPTFPTGSFGAAYVQYLDMHGFNPDERHPVRFIADPQLAYVMQRYREVHDLWHVLTGLQPTVLGETAVKWLEMVQTGMPVAALSAVVAPARLSSLERAAFWRVYVPWAATTGTTCVHLLSVKYESRWMQPLEDVRKELGIIPAPSADHAVSREWA